MPNHKTLVTYDCLHFSVLTSAAVADPQGTIIQLCEPSRAQIESKVEVTTHHLCLPIHCDHFACYRISDPEWMSRIADAICGVQGQLRSFQRGILHLSRIYHSIPLDARVYLCNDVVCGLAHRQLGIEKRGWKDDPFFMPYLEAQMLVHEVESSVSSVQGNNDSRLQLVTKINHCRALIAKLRGREEEIEEGVRKLYQAATEKVNQKMNDTDSIDEARERRASDAEAVRKLETAAARKKEMNDVDRATLPQQEASKKPTKRARCLELLAKIKGKSKSQSVLQGKKEESVTETAPAEMASPSPRISANPQTKPKRKTSATIKSGRRQRLRPTGVEKKALYSSALQVSFLERMQGF